MYRIFMVTTILASIVVGCSKQSPTPVRISDIVGTWESHSANVSELGVLKHQIVFRPDGLVEWKVISGNGQIRMTSSGNYVIQTDKLLFSGDIADILTAKPYHVSMPTPDTLVLNNDGVTEFIRIKDSENAKPKSQ